MNERFMLFILFSPLIIFYSLFREASQPQSRVMMFLCLKHFSRFTLQLELSQSVIRAHRLLYHFIFSLLLLSLGYTLVSALEQSESVSRSFYSWRILNHLPVDTLGWLPLLGFNSEATISQIPSLTLFYIPYTYVQFAIHDSMSVFVGLCYHRNHNLYSTKYNFQNQAYWLTFLLLYAQFPL